MAKSLDHGVVNSFLRGLRYPTSRDYLIKLAKTNRVPDELVKALQEMPVKTYNSQQEVMDQLEKIGHNIT